MPTISAQDNRYDALVERLEAQDAEVAALRAELNALQKQLADIEPAIGSSAPIVQRLALAEKDSEYLRQELQNLRTSFQQQFDQANREADRQYDLMKWVIVGVGLGMFAMMIGFAASLLQLRGKQESASVPQRLDDSKAS